MERRAKRERESGALLDVVADDSLAQVLQRLPLREMVRASAVCRRWLEIVRAMQKGACIDAWQDESRVSAGVPTPAATLEAVLFTKGGQSVAWGAPGAMMMYTSVIVAPPRVPDYLFISTIDASARRGSGAMTAETIDVVFPLNFSFPTMILFADAHSTIPALCDSAGRTPLLAIADGGFTLDADGTFTLDAETAFTALLDFAERSGVDVSTVLNTATASPYTNSWICEIGGGPPDVVAAGTTAAHLAIRRGKLAIARAALLRGGVVAPRLPYAQMSGIYDALVRGSGLSPRHSANSD